MKTLVRLSSLILTCLLAVSCGRSGSSSASAGKPFSPTPEKNDNILRLGNGDEPQGLDPHLISGVMEQNILSSLLEGLATEDPKTLQPIPGAAERWDLSADETVYTFHLRANGRWSNGDPVTAEDFRFSFERLLSPSLAAEYAYMLHVIKNARAFNEGKITDFNEVGVKVKDERTLEVTLEAPTAYFLAMQSHFCFFPVHKATILKYGRIDQRDTDWTKPGNFVGNGAFQLVDWKVNQVIRVRPNPLYWDAAIVKLAGIEFYPVKQADTEERMFRGGQLDCTTTLPLPKLDTYKKDYPHLLRRDPYLATGYYLFNTSRKPFDDVRVRRALALAVNRQLLCDRILKGGQTPAFFLTPPDTAGFTSRAALTGTLDEARQLLAAAGYPGGQGFPEVELLYNTSENHRILAEAIQQMWYRDLGIRVSLVNQEWKSYMDTRRKLGFGLCRAGWTGDYNDPMTFLDLFVTGGGNNNTGWSNPDYDKTIAEARRTSGAARLEAFQKAEAILAAELPILTLYHYRTVNLVHPRVQGWHPNLLDHHPYKYVSLKAD
jgi:oligopeptide transport system substrate-binding protein